MDAIEIPRWRVTTAPTYRPVSVAQVVDHLVLPEDGRTDKALAFLDSAIQQTQDDTARAFATQTITLYRDSFGSNRYIELPRPPLQSVTSVKYTPLATRVEVTLSTDDYLVDTESEPGRVIIKDDSDWPADELIEANGVTIVYVAGYGAKSSTATVTIASPGVFTWPAHGLINGEVVVLSTTGALPTGLTVGSSYYVVGKTLNTFQVSATFGGTAINTTGSQSGVHTISVDGRPSTMPPALCQAILLLTGDMYENREASVDVTAGNVSPQTGPVAYHRLISPHRIEVIV